MAGSVVDRHFDYLRKQREADINKQQQMSNESFERQAARQGMSGSGAMMKLRSQQEQEFGNQRGNAIDDVEGQRALALGEIEARDKAMAFQKEQAQLDRDFQGQQGQLGREHEMGMLQSNQAFQSSEAAAERGFNKDLFDQEMIFKNKTLKSQNSQFAQQMKLAFKQFALDKKVSNFNMDMATKQFNKKDMMEWFANMHGYDPRTGKQGSPGGGMFGGGGGQGAGGMFSQGGSGGGFL